MIDQAYSEQFQNPDSLEDGSGPQYRSQTLNKALEYLGLLETFVIGIFQEVYDAETAYHLYASRLIAVAENYRPLITRRRADSGRDSLYQELETLGGVFSAHRKAKHSSFHKCGCLNNVRLPELQRGTEPDGQIAHPGLS